MRDLCYKLLATQLTKYFEAIANSIGGWLLRFVSLRRDRPRFSVEVTYLREDHDFVFIYLELWIFMYI